MLHTTAECFIAITVAVFSQNVWCIQALIITIEFFIHIQCQIISDVLVNSALCGKPEITGFVAQIEEQV